MVVFAKTKEALHHGRVLMENGPVAIAAKMEIAKLRNDGMKISQSILRDAGLDYMSQTFFALVRGRPERDRKMLDLGLMRDPKTLHWKCAPTGGQITRTNYAVITTSTFPRVAKKLNVKKEFVDKRFSLLSLRCSTMLRHQMAGVCTFLKCPIVGDMEHSGGKFPIMFLHSVALRFKSVRGDMEYMIVDPPPWEKYGFPNMKELVESLQAPALGSLSDIYQRLQAKQPILEPTVSSESKIEK